MQSDRPFHATFLLVPGFPMACLTSTIEPLRAANEISGTNAFEWTLATENGDPAKASAGVSFTPDCRFQDATASDLFVVLAPPDGLLDADPGTVAQLRKRALHGSRVGAISGGVAVLGRCGLLEPDYRYSRHWCYRATFDEEFPHLHASDDVVVIDRSRYTASGAAGGFEMILGLIRERLGSEIMTEVACWFQHPCMRETNVKQTMPGLVGDHTRESLPPTVARAVELFETNLAEPIPIAAVARAVGVSTRQLERHFKQTFGRPPSAHYRRVRLNAARQMVRQSSVTLSSIAAAVGFPKLASMKRFYEAEFGRQASHDRNAAKRLVRSR